MSKAQKIKLNEKGRGERIAVIYCRVSSDRQKIEGHGLESQEHRCREYAAQKNYEVEKVFQDSFTGGGDFLKRPEFSQLLKYIDERPFKKFVLIIDDISRLARDTQAHFAIRDFLDLQGCDIECPNFTFEDTPEGFLNEGVHALFSDYHRRRNARQVVQKQAARLESGYWAFGSKKGYRMEPHPLHGKISVPKEPEASILREAMVGFANGTFVRKVDACSLLVSKGFWKKQSPEKYIDKFSLILQDSFYAGYIEYPAWEISKREGKHEGIISDDVFEKIQKRLKGEGLNKRIRLDLNPEFPLRGLLVCDECGQHLTGAISSGRTNKYSYYFCQNRGCDLKGKTLSKEKVEDGFNKLLLSQNLKAEVGDLVENIFDKVWDDEVGKLKKQKKISINNTRNLNEKIAELTELARKASSETLRRVYEKEIEVTVGKMEIEEGLIANDIDMSVSYRTALNKATGLLKSPYKIWTSVDLIEQQRLFYFIFNEKLPYSKLEGYRTDKIPSAVRLFEEFVSTNFHDVEMGGIEPPCR